MLSNCLNKTFFRNEQENYLNLQRWRYVSADPSSVNPPQYEHYQ